MSRKSAAITFVTATLFSYGAAHVFAPVKEYNLSHQSKPIRSDSPQAKLHPGLHMNALQAVGRNSASLLDLLASSPDLLESATFDSAFDALNSPEQQKLMREILKKWPQSRAAYVALVRVVELSSPSDCTALFNDPLVEQQWAKNPQDARREPSVLTLLAGRMDTLDLFSLSSNPATHGGAVPELVNALSNRGELQLVTEVWLLSAESNLKREQISRGILRAMMSKADDPDKLKEIANFASGLAGFHWKEAALSEVSGGPSAAQILRTSSISEVLPPAFKSRLATVFLMDSPGEAVEWAASQSADGNYVRVMEDLIGKDLWHRFLLNPNVGYGVATQGQDVIDKFSTEQKELMWQAIFRHSGTSALKSTGLRGREDLALALSAAQTSSPEAQGLYAKIPAGSGPAFLAMLADTHMEEARKIITGLETLDSHAAQAIIESAVQALNPSQATELGEVIFSKLPANILNEVAVQAGPALGRMLGSQGPTAESADRLISFLPPVAQSRTIETLMQAWAGQDLLEAAAWLHKLPSGDNKRAGARALLPHIASDSEAWNAWNAIAHPAAPTSLAP